MKRFAVTPLLVAMLALHACQTAPAGGWEAGSPSRAASIATTVAASAEGVVEASGTVLVKGTQGLIIAEEFYQGVNRAALTVVQSGRLSRNQLLTVQSLNSTATRALVVGKNAKDDAQRARAAALVMASALSLRRLIGL